ncbi:hypothetical protein BU14_0208s0034 [Porphyra umbilicalis]|uniref:Uncharacterized protein n=1 Tax=Porphyra umbilicalis TaxID=2786 RepID=A0A1X6P5G6_PORUM|nr:hypothetical protein BU14_0208s0034 [Porphyra umbilicalis]|eukprot:OSX76077.1 hypothetical protein BU14_0208s0034 [Porphyra umbilicalis]
MSTGPSFMLTGFGARGAHWPAGLATCVPRSRPIPERHPPPAPPTLHTPAPTPVRRAHFPIREHLPKPRPPRRRRGSQLPPGPRRRVVAAVRLPDAAAICVVQGRCLQPRGAPRVERPLPRRRRGRWAPYRHGRRDVCVRPLVREASAGPAVAAVAVAEVVGRGGALPPSPTSSASSSDEDGGRRCVTGVCARRLRGGSAVPAPARARPRRPPPRRPSGSLSLSLPAPPRRRAPRRSGDSAAAGKRQRRVAVARAGAPVLVALPLLPASSASSSSSDRGCGEARCEGFAVVGERVWGTTRLRREL